MKKLIAFLLLATVALTACKKKQEDILADIKKNTTKIDEKLKDWNRRQVTDLAPRKDAKMNGVITGYFRDEEVKKIEHQQFSDSFRVFADYYFDDGFLIYMVRQLYTYNAPASYTQDIALAAHDSNWYDDAKTTLQTSRFYFHKNKLIKWKDVNNEEVSPDDMVFQDRESAIWAEAAVLIRQLKAEDAQ